jgi:predicted AlkP superfamily pyrophosphatase or phosphodiesterase
MPKTLFILLDAFRGDYINPIDTPFLHQKTKEGVFASKLRSVAGFTQRTAIYSGAKGDESGMFTMFTFDCENSPFKFLANDPRLDYFNKQSHWWDCLPNLRGIGQLKRKLQDRYVNQPLQSFHAHIDREVKKSGAHAPRISIPLYMLPDVGVSEDNTPIHLPKALATETMFDVFVESGISYDYAMFPVISCQDDKVLDRILDQSNKDVAVILAQFADSDALVHHCGPSSYERRKVTGEIDRKLREIDAAYPSDVNWIIIGDHGMADVKEELDVQSLVGNLAAMHGVREGRDFLVFLDSTMARFKWKTDVGRSFSRAVMADKSLLAKGRFVDDSLASDYSIPIADSRYGDLIWWANIGVLIWPDYFHDLHTHNKGMHGYASDEHDMKGFFLAFGQGIGRRIIDEVHLVDVCPTICKAAGVRSPKQNIGRCLI